MFHNDYSGNWATAKTNLGFLVLGGHVLSQTGQCADPRLCRTKLVTKPLSKAPA